MDSFFSHVRGMDLNGPTLVFRDNVKSDKSKKPSVAKGKESVVVSPNVKGKGKSGPLPPPFTSVPRSEVPAADSNATDPDGDEDMGEGSAAVAGDREVDIELGGEIEGREEDDPMEDGIVEDDYGR